MSEYDLMSDFTSPFWAWFIFIITVGGIFWCFYLLLSQSKGDTAASHEEAQPTGHKWDETLEELNTPLPRWWLQMFIATNIFGLVYLVLYPGTAVLEAYSAGLRSVSTRMKEKLLMRSLVRSM